MIRTTISALAGSLMPCMGCGQYSRKLLPPAPIRVLANDHLPRMSRQSRLLVNDKGNNEMNPRAVYRSPRIYLTAKENTGKPQLGDFLTKAVRQAIALNGVPYFQMTSIGSYSTSGGIRKEYSRGWGRWIFNLLFMESWAVAKIALS